MKISIVIPTYQEKDCITDMVKHLLDSGEGEKFELIITDGGSSDLTCDLAKAAGAQVVVSPKKGRAAQLNYGAQLATGDILYFLHADTFPPKGFLNDIREAVQSDFQFGMFRQHIQSKNKWVRFNSYASRSEGIFASGGDQSLFMTRTLFDAIGGYQEDLRLMEDYDIVKRASKKAKSTKIPKNLEVIDRKYEYNGYLRVNLSNAAIFGLYALGVHPNKLYPLYKKWIKGPRYKDLK